MSVISAQDIFELKPLLTNIDIKLCARSENGVKQILALVRSEGDVVLYYTYGELPPVLNRIPWFNDSFKHIEAICFDPSATWLLVVSLDCSLYIIPALSLVDKKQKIDCKWSLTDLTYFARPAQIPDSKPTTIIWWQTLDCNQNALVGFENGTIVLISLTDGRRLGSCNISESVDGLNICHDNNLETVSLLINGVSGQQWKFILEQHSTGYLWPPETPTQAEDSTRSRLYSLKQLGVDKLASWRQRLTEARGNRKDSQSDSTSESSHTESVNSTSSGPELLPHLSDTHFAPQYARNRYLFTAFYKPTSLLTVHTVDIDSAPLYVHKLPEKISSILLTDRLIYTVNDDSKMVAILSSYLSECRLEGEAEFKSDSVIAQFNMENEKIIKLFKLADLSSFHVKKKEDNKKDKVFELPKSVEDLNIQKPRIDTCVIVTDCSVYKICVSCSPIKKFVEYVTEENDLNKAEKISKIFGLNNQQLLESCGDLLISRGSYHSGIILYNKAKVHLLKRVLKLAISADCRTLLKFIHLCLSASKVDMSVATKIHIGNLAVMAYTELILRYGGHERVSNTKDFMNFLSFEEYYDQILAVNVACQAGHWNIVTLLAKSRGLQPEVVTALGQILQIAKAPKPTETDFIYCLSEPCLTQSLLIFGQYSQYIFQFVRENVESFSLDILCRLAVQLDPSQPCAIPLVSRLFQNTKYSSSLDTTIESVDFDNPDGTIITVKDLIDTFLVVLIHLVRQTEKNGFQLALLDSVALPETSSPPLPVKLPDLHPLSCGFEHAAVIRNNNVYTMGVASAGCLGLGPLLTQSSPARLVHTLSELKVKVLSVSCGKKHTLALTDFGVYSWGSNTYGQLGLGQQVQESPYPQILSALSSIKIVDLAAGQYHSIGLSSTGRVYTWGWGIHGQLGHGNCDNQFLPKLLDFSETVKQITAGHAHTLILTNDGKIYGFGSNVFGQLEGSQIEGNKFATPVWVLVPADSHVPIEKVATAYFHNITILKDQEVHTWGASPQEVRLFQSKNNQKQSGVASKSSDSWKTSTHIYSSINKKHIEQVAVGYRHSVVLHNGKLLWGKNKEELCTPKLKQQDDANSFYGQRFIHVSCGLDYTMAIDHTGKLLAWGSPSMAQTILGKSIEEDNRRLESRVIVFKNTKRVIKLAPQGQGSSENLPIEVPGLPSMAITFNPSDQKLLFSKNFIPYAVCKIENKEVTTGYSNTSSLDSIYESPKLKFGYKTLHYVLETYHGFYDTDNILAKCLEVENYQAAAKIAMLDGHFGDSLGFQLVAFKKHIDSLNLNLDFTYTETIPTESKDYIELIVRNIQGDLNEKKLVNSNNSSGQILSTSSSLDSIRQWGDDVEHQGGRESPCEAHESGDIRQNISHYVQSLTNNDASPPICSVSKMVSEIDNVQIKMKQPDYDLRIKDKEIRDVLDAASYLVEFYIRKIYVSENHILMQNILMKCIEFWLSNNLPVPVLENTLLKNMDKYFYPLSILLFCKDFSNPEDDDSKPTSSGFLKEFSTKFCLQLCSMVLENVDKT